MGTDGYLLKPVSKETLIQKVKEMCQRRNQQEKRKTIVAVDDDMVFLKLINSYLQDTYNVVIINFE